MQGWQAGTDWITCIIYIYKKTNLKIIYDYILAPFTHTDFTGKLPVNCRKEFMCEQALFKNTGKLVPAIYQYEKL